MSSWVLMVVTISFILSLRFVCSSYGTSTNSVLVTQQTKCPVPVAVVPTVEVGIPEAMVTGQPTMGSVHMASADSTCPGFRTAAGTKVTSVDGGGAPSPVEQPRVPRQMSPGTVHGTVSTHQYYIQGRGIPVVPEGVFDGGGGVVRGYMFGSFARSISWTIHASLGKIVSGECELPA